MNTRREIIKGTAMTATGMILGGVATAKSTSAGQPIARSSNNESKPLSGKVALITGAAMGIGRATTIALARQGANVALLDIADPQGVENISGYRLANSDELNEAVELVSAEGVEAIPIITDVRNLKAMKEAAKTTNVRLSCFTSSRSRTRRYCRGDRLLDAVASSRGTRPTRCIAS